MMKKLFYLPTFIGIILMNSLGVYAQNNWIQKIDFGGIARDCSPVGFSIGTKGYIATGNNNGTFLKDFWEWDQTNNTWTQKADFGGTPRGHAVGFSIGTKGYIGTGGNGTSGYKDFWEYDQSNNTWTQKADFGGTAREGAVGFSIGSKGYIGTGYSFSGIYHVDFWEYDQSNNTWTQKADFGGGIRAFAVGFSIGTKGYIGTGINGTTFTKDFWEYDQSNNTWTQKADFGGTARSAAVSFSIRTKGYIGTGNDGTFTKDFWEYDQSNNTWTQKADFGGTPRVEAGGFSICSKGYIGIGWDSIRKKDFWEFTTCSTPSIAIQPISQSLCVGENAIFAVTASTDESNMFQWQYNGTNISGANDSSLILMHITSSDSGNYNCIINGCCTIVNSNIATLTVNPLPIANAIKDTIVCIGVKDTLSATGGVSYLWSFNNSTTQNIIVSPSSTSTYVVTVTDANGCTASDDAIVTVDTLNYISISLDSNNALLTCNQLFQHYQWFLNGNIITGAISQTLTPLQNGLYSVEGTDSIGCSVTSSQFNYVYVGNSEFENSNSFIVFPNPSNDHITISTFINSTMEILNIEGQIILQQQIVQGKTNIDISDFSSGVYIIRARTEKGITTKKFIKE